MRLFSTHPSTEERIARLQAHAMNEVRVNRKAADRVASGHPWIFSSDITDRGRRPAGRGGHESRTRAAGRWARRTTARLRRSLCACSRGRSKRSAAISICAGCGRPKRIAAKWSATPNAYRVVHGEADLLPALVVDRYGDYLVMQTLDQGMDAAKTDIASCLEEIFAPRGIVARNDVAVRAKEQLPLESTVLAGEVPESVAVEMNGLHLRADLLHGQKTGIFLDQRENYRAAARYARGGTALDCFTSTGGFRAAPGARAANRWRRWIPPAPALATARAQRRGQRHRQHRVHRGRRIRPAGGLRRARGGVSRWWCWTRRPSPNRAATWRRPPRATRRSTCARCACSRPAASW